jgi:hypothetical protein
MRWRGDENDTIDKAESGRVVPQWDGVARSCVNWTRSDPVICMYVCTMGYRMSLHIHPLWEIRFTVRWSHRWRFCPLENVRALTFPAKGVLKSFLFHLPFWKKLPRDIIPKNFGILK